MSERHALIIDDDDYSLEVMSRLLALQKIKSTRVQDSRDLPALLGQLGQLDMVFLDLEMPYATGFELLEVLRQSLPPHVPIIAYSVHNSEVHAAHDAGFDGFLGKPLDPTRFPQHIQRILNHERVWDIG